MSKYIDKEVLLADIAHTISESGLVEHSGEILDRIEFADVEDVMPVVHGIWIEHEGYYECLCCKNLVTCDTNYCPRCGARMEGDEK